MKKLILNMKKVIGIVLAVSILITSSGSNFATYAAESLNLTWLDADSMDGLLNIARSTGNDREILLKWTGQVVGKSYSLDYKLPRVDGSIYTYRLEYLITNSTTLQVGIRVYDGATDVTSVFAQSMTETNFNLDIPEAIHLDNTARLDAQGRLIYNIDRGARYSGIAITLGDTILRTKWVGNEIYFYTDSVLPGYIIPFTLTSSGVVEEKEILASLANLTAEPTHMVDATTNLKTINIPNNTNEMPGGRPGFEISFSHPKRYVGTSFVDAGLGSVNAQIMIKSVATSGGLNNQDGKQLLIPLSQANGSIGGGSDDSGAQRGYTYSSGRYYVNLVKENEGLGNNYFVWNNIEGNQVYNIEINLDGNLPENLESRAYKHYAYTYLQYTVKRASYEDAYLQITPYTGNDASENKYTVRQGNTSGSLSSYLVHHQPASQVDQPIYIPIEFFGAAGSLYYDVIVTFAERELKSQIINYNPSLDTEVEPPIPKINEITNITVLPSTDGTTVDKVQFDLTFNAPSLNVLREILKDGNSIYYELLANKTPNDISSSKYEPIKVYKVALDASNMPVVTILENGGETEIPEEGLGFSDGYNSAESRFGVKNIILKDNVDTSTVGLDWIRSLLRSNDPVEYNETTNKPIDGLGVYYLKMRALVVDASGNYVSESQNSVTESISLGLTTVEVPIPTYAGYEPVIPEKKEDSLGFDVKMNAIDIAEYAKYMLTPIGKQVNEIKYELYLSTDRDKLNVSTMDSIDEADAIIIDPSNTEGITLDSELALLRNSGVLKFVMTEDVTSLGILSQKILGVDPNQIYHMRMRAVLVGETGEGEAFTETSGVSNLLTITSPKNPWVDDHDTNLPLAPENLEVIFKEGSSTEATIDFDYKEELKLEDPIRFEILAIKDKTLPQAYQKLPMPQIARELIRDYGTPTGTDRTRYGFESYRVIEQNGVYVLQYLDITSPTNPRWVEDNTIAFEVNDNHVRLESKGLSPNTIYYYYVRTVSEVDGSDKFQSSVWMMDTLTTSPVLAPINLIVPQPIPSEFTPHDNKSEILVRVDVPIPRENFITSGNSLVRIIDYGIQVHVKGEDDLDYSDSKYSARFVGFHDGGKAEIDGYTRVYYRISGLKSGKSYGIKVRIEDLTKIEINPKGERESAKSNFSPLVTYRTNFDQIDYEKEQKYLQYIQYYENQAAKLKEAHYWVVQDSESSYSIKYRDVMAANQMPLYRNSNYNLPSSEANRLSYYIPVEMLGAINLNRTALIIQTEANDFGFRANTISEQITKELQNVVSNMKNSNSNVKDYLIKIDITKGKYNGLVNGSTPVSELVDVQMKVATMNIVEDYFDIEILRALDNLIASRKTILINALEKELITGINDSRLHKIVTDILAQIEKDLQRVTENTLKGRVLTELSVSSLGQPVSISWNKVQSSAVLNGFRRSGSLWETIQVLKQGSKYTLNGENPGSYILASLSGTTGLDLDPQSLDVIVKYNLGTIFTNAELRNLEMIPTKSQLLTVAARVLGASSTDNAVNYLKNKGMNFVNGLNMSGGVKKVDAYLILSRVYELKKGISLKNVAIRNYNSIKDINDLSSDHQKTLLAAYQLQLFTANDGYMNPNSNITLRELLYTLRTVE